VRKEVECKCTKREFTVISYTRISHEAKVRPVAMFLPSHQRNVQNSVLIQII